MQARGAGGVAEGGRGDGGRAVQARKRSDIYMFKWTLWIGSRRARQPVAPAEATASAGGGPQEPPPALTQTLPGEQVHPEPQLDRR